LARSQAASDQCPVVYGFPIDDQTRCVHYHGPTDVVAIKFPCCERFYPCFFCHEETADHPALRWSVEALDEPAILCGVCQHVLTIRCYLRSKYHCPFCGTAFNPGCAHHTHLYFAFDPRDVMQGGEG
jgi:uncharacterized CHY-type Zn-finger protein